MSTEKILQIELEPLVADQWLADIPELNIKAIGDSKDDAVTKIKARAFRVLADQLDSGNEPTFVGQIFRFGNPDGVKFAVPQ